MYIFGTPQSKLITMLGYLEGPKVIPQGVEYMGCDDNKTMLWNFSFKVKDSSKGSDLTVISEINYKPRFIDRLFGKEVKDLQNEFNFAKHILDAHLLPYLRLYGYVKGNI